MNLSCSRDVLYKGVVNLLVARRSILLIWVRSRANDDCWTALDSRLPIRVKILSVNPMIAASAGTKDPMCAMMTMTPTCLA